MNYKRVILVVSLSLIFALQALLSQTAEETRVIEKSFAVSGEMSFEVINKYGKIHLSHTDADSVNISIEMHASAPNQSKLRKLIDGVSFDLNSTNYFIIAETNFIKGPATLFESIRSLTNNIISSESRLEVNYYIEVPVGIDVKIDNRYGDIYIESISCNLDVTLSNGSLRAEDLTGNSSFDLSFFNSTINSLTTARMNLSYGEIKVSHADDLNIKSSSSRLEIGTANRLFINSKRDKYYIDFLSKLEGESYFSEVSIDQLSKSISISTKYGSLSVDKLEDGFELFSLYSDYTSVYLSTDKKSSFNLDIKVINCPTSMPGEWVIEEKIISEERKEYLYFGQIGNARNRSQIKINSTRGRLILD
jgi:hypothetical protein